MPSLGLPALKTQLADGRLAPLYVFVGEDLKLMDRMVDAVEATVDPADRPFAVERVYAGEPGGMPIDIVSSARVMPMLGPRRIVIVLRAERLLKPKRAAKTSLIDDETEPGNADEPLNLGAIEEYVDAPVSFSTVVFVASEVDRSRRLTKRLLERAQVVEFGGFAADGPTGRREGRRTAVEWLQEELTRAGRTIETEAAATIVSRAGHDISKLRGDVERLLLYTEGRRRITADDVMEVVVDEQAVEDDWAVVNAIANGDVARAVLETGRRLDRGDSPHALVGQLRWWVSSRLADGDSMRVKPALEALIRTDLALKSSGGEPRVLLERLVVDLTGRPLPQRGGWGRT